MKKKINWDAIGITASIACAIHCAILPILLTSLPIFGFDILDNIWFEGGMIAIAFFVGLTALRHGKRHHHSNVPYYWFAGGFLFLILKEVFHQYHTAFLVPAIIGILVGHFYNVKLMHDEKKDKSSKYISCNMSH